MRAMSRSRSIAALLTPILAIALVACGDDSPTGGGGAGQGAGADGGANEGGGGAGQGGSLTSDFVAGGDRPVDVHLPEGYDPAQPSPLVILLHGYTVTGAIQNAYFGFQAVASQKGLIFLAPDGMVDAVDNPFWNATDACCNFGTPKIDDSAYLIGLVDEISGKVNVDPARVYFMGHSNGGFMSHRMACDHADQVAAIVSLAGATHDDPADCAASEPVSVLQIHGTLDDTILYPGGDNGGNPYPGAEDTVAAWATIDGCDTPSVDGAPRDLESVLAGDESTTSAYAGCEAGTTVELWTIEGGGHIPTLSDDFTEQAVDWLLTHSK